MLAAVIRLRMPTTILLAAASEIDPHPLSMLPFVALLLCIALLPFILKHHWERNYHFIALLLAAITASYYCFALHRPERILHEGVDYISFIALVGSLFVVAGGIHIEVAREAKPFFNCVFLAAGGLLGNVFGTTGASMLLIRPWIRLNKYRYTALHTAFFIFIVSNVGGGLIPMGPPLFLGYLKGVPFWWVLEHCWQPWTVAMIAFLIIFYGLDRHNYRRAPRDVRRAITGENKFQISGLRNLCFLAFILAAVFIEHPPFLREGLMLSAAIGSYFATPKQYHGANEFSFAPLKEVAWLFLGIFFTMVPVLDFMKLHARDLAIDSPAKFYWVTGTLSSVLDNAPTYLTFLANALGRNRLSVENPAELQQFLGQGAREVAAISLGAVFFGAATYIGNSPNFMIKAIAEEHKMPTPGFLRFVFKFALPVVLPVVFLVFWLSFRQ
jgi:Na+/H+ antiporter NhaD/arsenite permease-like protein